MAVRGQKGGGQSITTTSTDKPQNRSVIFGDGRPVFISSRATLHFYLRSRSDRRSLETMESTFRGGNSTPSRLFFAGVTSGSFGVWPIRERGIPASSELCERLCPNDVHFW